MSAPNRNSSSPHPAEVSNADHNVSRSRAENSRSSPGDALFAGAIVARRFALKRLIGRGGMGVVWEVHDKTLGRDVALKFLGSEIASDLEAVTDLQRETRRSLELTHPNIVRVYDYIEDNDFQLVGISMELLTGQSLQAVKLQQTNWAFTPDAIYPWLRQICAALDYAHQTVGVVHRDLKPGNIFINERGTLKIVDFGVAMVVRESTSHVLHESRLSRSGTLTYMSPQQLRGDKPTPADDWYSVGALLYELFTGKPPFFRGDPQALMHQVMTHEPVSIAERQAEMGITNLPVPPMWEKAIRACLAKDAAARPISGAALLALLDGYQPPVKEASVSTASAVPFPLVDADKTVLQQPPLSARTRAVNPLLSQAPLRKGTDSGDSLAESAPAAVSNPEATGPVAKRISRDLAVLSLVVVMAAAAVVFFLRQSPKPEPVVSTPPAPAVAPVVAAGFTLNIDPHDARAEVQIDDRLPMVVPPNGRLVVRDLPDGEHILSAQAPGFEPFKARTTFRGNQGEFNIGLVPLRASIEVVARSNSRVILRKDDGTEVILGQIGFSGRAVFPDAVRAGEVTLRLEHPDCVPTDLQRFTVVADQTTPLKIEQTLLPASLSVTTLPAGAELFVNGESQGTAPVALKNLKAGEELQLEVRLDGYETERRKYTLSPREHREQAYKLQPMKGDLVVAARPGTRVTARRAEQSEIELGIVGSSGETTFSRLLPLGRWSLSFDHKDCLPAGAIEVEIEKGALARVVPNQRPLPARLDIRSDPVGLEVRVQGVNQGITPAVIESLPAETPLFVELRPRGRTPITRTVTLRPGEKSTLVFDRLAAEYAYVKVDVQPWEQLRGHNLSFFVDGTPVAPRSRMGSVAVIRFDAGVDHLLQVQADGFSEQSLTIDPSNELGYRVTLEPLKAQLAISTEPAHAQVWLNDVGPRETPVAYSQLAPGRYKMRIEKPGFRSHVQDVVLDAGDDMKLPPVVLSATPPPVMTIPSSIVAPNAVTVVTPSPAPPPAAVIPSGAQSVGSIKLSGHTRLYYILNVVQEKAIALGWSVLKSETNVVVLNLKRFDYDATLYLRCHPNMVEVFSDSYRSTALGRLKQTPVGWVNVLQSELARQLY